VIYRMQFSKNINIIPRSIYSCLHKVSVSKSANHHHHHHQSVSGQLVNAFVSVTGSSSGHEDKKKEHRLFFFLKPYDPTIASSFPTMAKISKVVGGVGSGLSCVNNVLINSSSLVVIGEEKRRAETVTAKIMKCGANKVWVYDHPDWIFRAVKTLSRSLLNKKPSGSQQPSSLAHRPPSRHQIKETVPAASSASLPVSNLSSHRSNKKDSGIDSGRNKHANINQSLAGADAGGGDGAGSGNPTSLVLSGLAQLCMASVPAKDNVAAAANSLLIPAPSIKTPKPSAVPMSSLTAAAGGGRVKSVMAGRTLPSKPSSSKRITPSTVAPLTSGNLEALRSTTTATATSSSSTMPVNDNKIWSDILENTTKGFTDVQFHTVIYFVLDLNEPSSYGDKIYHRRSDFSLKQESNIKKLVIKKRCFFSFLFIRPEIFYFDNEQLCKS
jgi:hypothetical protein